MRCRPNLLFVGVKMIKRLMLIILAAFISSPWANAATTSTISQHGITWTFSSPVEYGQFVNGDYWVVDLGSGVEIVGISPGWVTSPRGMNGSMINPTSPLNGYDTIAGGYGGDGSEYSAAVNVGTILPLILHSGDSLVSTISNTSPYGADKISYVKTAAILTCLASAPPSGTFRPGYYGTGKALYNFNNLDKSKLQNLSYSSKPSPTSFKSYASMPFLHSVNATARYMHPSDFTDQSYGGRTSDNYYWPNIIFGPMALMLHLDYASTDKDALLINFIQIGIDMFSILKANGVGWSPDGGSKNGAKLPILYAAVMLNDTEMLGYLQRSGDYAFSGGHDQSNLPSDYVKFGEDAVFYINQTQVDITNTVGWRGYNELRGAVDGTDFPYTSAMLGMPEWINRNASWGDCTSSWAGNPYRTVRTGGGEYFPQAAMAVSMLTGGKIAWNNNAFFDYVDRYMLISGGGAYSPEVTNQTSGGRPGGFTGGMWDSYQNHSQRRLFRNVRLHQEE